MYDHQAKKLNEQGTFKEIVVEISARQLSAKSETLRQMSMFLTQAVFMEVCVHPKTRLSHPSWQRCSYRYEYFDFCCRFCGFGKKLSVIYRF